MADRDIDGLALPDLAAIRAARERIAPYVHVTPVFTSHSLDELIGAQLFLKCENLQKVGAFKARGACNAVFSLSAEAAARGVVTHSSGNHGAALAYAARCRGIAAHVVMPDNAPKIKIANVEGFGAKVHFCAAQRRGAREGVLRGRARDGRDARASVRRPRGDRGAGYGGARAARSLSRSRRGRHAGRRRRPAVGDVDRHARHRPGHQGLRRRARGGRRRVARLRERQGRADAQSADDRRRACAARCRRARWARCARTCRAIATCSEGAIVAAMRLVWERAKIVIEPSSAVPLAAMLEGTLDVRRQARGRDPDRRQRRPRPPALAALNPKMRIVISEFMDEPAVEALRARFDVLYDKTLVDRRAGAAVATRERRRA